MTLIIVTGASQNHFLSLCQFLKSVNMEKYQCYVYDLGLLEESANKLRSTFSAINYRKFDYSKYPEYFNINIAAGEYAWKPTLISELVLELESTNLISPDTVLLWCDAGNKIVSDLTNIYEHTLTQKIYSPISSGNIKQYTHDGTLLWFNKLHDISFQSYQNRNGAILAFSIGDPIVRDFIRKFADCAGIKDCIAPSGSSRENHRQDQAVFTVLYYLFIQEYNLPVCSGSYLGITIHNDIG